MSVKQPQVQQAHGLFAFKDLTGDPHNSMCLRIRFSERVTPIHKAQVYDAIHAWMLGQKLILENDGKLPTPEQAMASLQGLHGHKEEQS